MKKSKGRTLVEVVVASALLLLLTGYMVQLMISSQKRLQRLEKLVKMEEDAIRALSQINVDLSESHFECVANPAANFVVFPAARDLSGQLIVAPTGELLWSTMVCYREETISDKVALLRQVEDIPDSPGEAPNPDTILPVTDLSFFQSGTGPKRVLGQGLESLSIRRSGDNTLEVELHLNVQLARNTQGIRLTSKVVPRN